MLRAAVKVKLLFRRGVRDDWCVPVGPPGLSSRMPSLASDYWQWLRAELVRGASGNWA